MQKTKGLIAAPFTPMLDTGEINLGLIPQYANKLKKDGVKGVFICGTTGEGMLMTLDERKKIAEAWLKEKTENFKVIVHVGTTSSKQSNELANHAQTIGADAIGCMGPLFLKPSKNEDLVNYCSEVASGAPDLPFYYYHIPIVSDVWISMPEFLKEAQHKIPNLAGIKFTHRNAMEMMQCIEADNGRWDILHGFDEELLCGLTVGAKGAVGSTYNYIASIYLKLIDAFKNGDMEKARYYQSQSIKLVKILIKYGGGVLGGKPVMKMVGLDCGPLRTPAHNLSSDEFNIYKKELDEIGFFNWIN